MTQTKRPVPEDCQNETFQDEKERRRDDEMGAQPREKEEAYNDKKREKP
ncbi:hypothetical protein SOASR030_21160 [Leminorella grimontii]|uniref:Uncharacterized protein n=1 Tax=Leminorella grimontii TaxID=82981 RepID=A0AAV5N2S0_9GAMM|nr:hypothetical protein [Leminorella grimontii]KFC96857.1 hypothetical protein GLGR_0856 [Leminorella grimontii ATCC 33999 = DSM 5078]GKX56004.1 hypothetical protein SOASR030_21160 [Leminorella grimontii]VFS57663.1 Uncharacterised protein [Leminorella grimontii]